jgi:hypothetical protein
VKIRQNETFQDSQSHNVSDRPSNAYMLALSCNWHAIPAIQNIFLFSNGRDLPWPYFILQWARFTAAIFHFAVGVV